MIVWFTWYYSISGGSTIVSEQVLRLQNAGREVLKVGGEYQGWKQRMRASLRAALPAWYPGSMKFGNEKQGRRKRDGNREFRVVWKHYFCKRKNVFSGRGRRY